MPAVPFPPEDPARPPARPGLRDLLDAHRPAGSTAGLTGVAGVAGRLAGGLTAGRALTGLAVAAVVVVGGIVLWPRPAAPDPELVLPRASTTLSLPATLDGGASAAAVGAAGSSTTVAELVVDVVGEVRAPGVRRVPPGSRVGDVIEAAGGLTARADRARINLAAPVADGERIFVPAVGQPVPPVAVGATGGAGAAAAGGAGGAGTDTAGPEAPVNLNTASPAELETLPGVGPATAQAIIDHREQQGPFRSVDDLLDVRGIGDAKLAELRDRVVV